MSVTIASSGVGDSIGRSPTTFDIEADLAEVISGKLAITLSPRSSRDSSAAKRTIRALPALPHGPAIHGRHAGPNGALPRVLSGRRSSGTDYALAHAALAEAYVIQVVHGTQPREEGLRIAKSSNARALELDPDLAEAHTVKG